MSTATFVHSGIRSKYTGFLSKSVDYAANTYYNPVRYLFWEHACAGSFTVSMCDKLVYLCVHIICVYSTCLCVCVCVCVCVVCVCVCVCVWCVCVCVCVCVLLNTIDTTKNPIRYLFLEHSCAGFLCSF